MVAITRSLRSAFLFGMTFLLAGLSWAQKVAEEPLRMTVVQTTKLRGHPCSRCACTTLAIKTSSLILA